MINEFILKFCRKLKGHFFLIGHFLDWNTCKVRFIHLRLFHPFLSNNPKEKHQTKRFCMV